MSIKNPILQSVSRWFERNFSDPEALSLFMTLLMGLLLIELMGNILLPVLVSVILTYLLNALVNVLVRWKMPHLLAVMLVYLLFLGVFVYFLVGLLPMLWRQLANLVHEMPNAFAQSQTWINELIQKYPAFFPQEQVKHLADFFRGQTNQVGQTVVKYSLSTIPNVIQVVLYFVLVPILVFFFLKDSDRILLWLSHYMPSNRGLVRKVWAEVNHKIGAYVKGRVLEIILVGGVSAITFTLLDLQYAVLLGALVGLSVIVPYVGAVVVTIPVVIIGLMQWGFSAHFAYLIIAYTVIIILDANVLVPVLFSESMDLHPVVIILAVIIFGGIWGFWGVFFAIPLATLVDAVLRAWPRPAPHTLN